MSGRFFQIGKVPPETLSKIIYPHLGYPNPRMLLGPGIGRDYAAVKYGRLLVLTTDPVTGTSHRIGQHSVYINSNDIATAGAIPVWYMCTILLPPKTTSEELSKIVRGIDSTCRKLRIQVIRGHTEVTKGLERPIVVGFMIGERQGKLFRHGNIRAGDKIVMTGKAGIEGTAILASDFSDRLKRIPEEVLSRARKFSNQISIQREALIISKMPGVRVMHDPTEGGILNACWELAESSDLGMEIFAENIPVAAETRSICSSLGLDPLKLMSSGCLLAVIDSNSFDYAIRRLSRLEVRASSIGTMTTRRAGRTLFRNGRSFGLRPVPQDELYKLS